MVGIVRQASDVEFQGRFGKTVTYNVTAATEFTAEEKVLARAVAGSPLSVGALEITDSERLTSRDEPLQEFNITVFIPNETIVQRLGAERAKDGLRALGVLGEK